MRTKILFLFCVTVVMLGSDSCQKNAIPLELLDPTPPPPPPLPDPLTGNTFTSLTSGNFNGAVKCLVPYNNTLMVGGYFSNFDSNNSSGLASTGGTSLAPYYFPSWNGGGISAFDMYNGSLFAGGSFSMSTGPDKCAEWNGSTWANTWYNVNAQVHCLTHTGNALIVGGAFINFNSLNFNHIAMFTSGAYQTMGNGFNGDVYAVCVYNYELYAAGAFTLSGSTQVDHIAKWNGLTWVPVGTGTNGTINCMCVYNNELYVGGAFSTADGNPASNIAKWDGTNWSPLGQGVGNVTFGVLALYSCNNKLLVGGDFTSAGGSGCPKTAKWDGTNWSDLGCYIPGSYLQATSFALFNNKLFMGFYNSNTGRGYLYRLD